MRWGDVPTTRKFFCESGGWVTCYAVLAERIGSMGRGVTYAYAGQKHARHCVLRLLATSDYTSTDFTYLIANHGQELPVFVLRRGSRHDFLCEAYRGSLVQAWCCRAPAPPVVMAQMHASAALGELFGQLPLTFVRDCLSFLQTQRYAVSLAST
jgi:hypothetical protein